MTRIPAVAAAVLLTAALLTSCSTAPSPAASGAAGGDPSPTPSAEAIEPAGSCLSIDTTEPTVTGEVLGTCFADALTTAGTAKAHHELDDGDVQDVEFRLRPDQALHATTVDEGGTTELVYLDGVAYQNEGDGWLKGDPKADDPEEAIVGAAGAAMLAMFNGQMLKQSVSACPLWNIEAAPKKLTLPDDEVVQARVFSCAAPFESLGATVDRLTVWMGADWIPYGHEDRVTGFGQVVSGRTLFYDHGVEVEITAPM